MLQSLLLPCQSYHQEAFSIEDGHTGLDNIVDTWTGSGRVPAWEKDFSRDITPKAVHSHNDYGRRVPLFEVLFSCPNSFDEFPREHSTDVRPIEIDEEYGSSLSLGCSRKGHWSSLHLAYIDGNNRREVVSYHLRFPTLTQLTILKGGTSLGFPHHLELCKVQMKRLFLKAQNSSEVGDILRFAYPY